MRLYSFVTGMIAAAAWTAATSFGDEPLLGVFGENSMQRVAEFEKWLGRPVDSILCTVDYFKWENYRYADWLSQTVYGARGQRRLVYDVPIIITGATYASAVAGDYDEHWRSLANSIIANNSGEFDIVLRPSHEMNADWFPWGVGGSRLSHVPEFIQAWRRFHGVFRGIPGGARFKFSFSTSEGASDPRPMWPGDEYVDFVGHDLYWKPKSMGGEGWETEDPIEAWENRVKNKYDAWRLGGMHAFAQSRKKPFQIDEWGASGPTAAPFIEAMAKWLRANGIRSHTYWNSNSGYPGELHSRQKEWPAATKAFKEAFGSTRR